MTQRFVKFQGFGTARIAVDANKVFAVYETVRKESISPNKPYEYQDVIFCTLLLAGEGGEDPGVLVRGSIEDVFKNLGITI